MTGVCSQCGRTLWPTDPRWTAEGLMFHADVDADGRCGNCCWDDDEDVPGVDESWERLYRELGLP